MLQCLCQQYQHSTGLLSMWQTKKHSSQCDDMAFIPESTFVLRWLRYQCSCFSRSIFLQLYWYCQREGKDLLHKDLDLGSQISNRSPAPDSSKPNVRYITTGSLPPSRTSDAMPDPWDSKTAWHSKGVEQKWFVWLIGMCANVLFI